MTVSRRLFLSGLPALAAPAWAGEKTLVQGAGASFPQPVYAAWAAQYRRQGGVEIRYEAIGSGAGLERMERGELDFGATDVPLAAAELQRLGLVQFPAIVGGVVPVLNLGGIKPDGLRLSGAVLADIYLGRIAKWNDPALARLNPGIDLPSSRITVVHRADSSGTSYLWSEFLSRSSTAWRGQLGTGKQTLAWPTGVAERGNEGVASAVQRTRASIGYVEFAYARQHRLGTASVQNREGRFVQAGLDSFKAAVEAGGDLQQQQQLLVDAPGASSWPITGASFILLRRNARNVELLKFFGWALRHGQPWATGLDYLPLPAAAVDLVEQRWAEQLGWKP